MTKGFQINRFVNMAERPTATNKQKAQTKETELVPKEQKAEVISGDRAEHWSSQQAGALWLCV